MAISNQGWPRTTVGSGTKDVSGTLTSASARKPSEPRQESRAEMDVTGPWWVPGEFSDSAGAGRTPPCKLRLSRASRQEFRSLPSPLRVKILCGRAEKGELISCSVGGQLAGYRAVPAGRLLSECPADWPGSVPTACLMVPKRAWDGESQRNCFVGEGQGQGRGQTAVLNSTRYRGLLRIRGSCSMLNSPGGGAVN